MNWWKLANLSNFEDRNILNDRLDDLKEITVKLEKLAKLVFQTASGTKEMLKEILDTKRLSTFPSIQKMLVEADKCCLDSPHRFADLCKKAGAQIVLRVTELEKQRKTLVEKTIPEKWKKWRDRE